MDSDSKREPKKLMAVISQLIFFDYSDSDYTSDVVFLIIQIISLVNSMDLDSQSQSQPESELISLITQTISLFNSMDLDSLPKPLRKLISFISQIFSLVNSTDSDLDLKLEPDQVLEFMSLVDQSLELKPEPELMSLIHKIFSLVISMNSKTRKLISLCPQVEVTLENGKFKEIGGVWWRSHCCPSSLSRLTIEGEDATHFWCRDCNGKNHKEYDEAPLEIKHTLHPKNNLRLVMLQRHYGSTRECYCCDADLDELFYYCSICDFAIRLACVEKPPVLAIDHPKWHEHTLTLFPRHTSSTCDLCGLADSSSPFYICSLCAFVVHQKCLNLPRVIRISRHPHRVSFTPCFDKRDWSCRVCHRKIDNDYGGYSCSKGDYCLYAAHSRCATQRDVWDGLELEGVLEEIEDEEYEPFIRIDDEIIQHFSHKHPSLRLDENTGKDYDENKMCQVCIMPIYFDNFYSCMQCEFILHERCAHLPRKIHHPLHPHSVTLVGGYDNDENNCSACPWLCTAGFFYECASELCRFKLHVQCATTSEPLDHESHIHPLYLTSRPGEEIICCVCKQSGNCSTSATFNCIECDFALCFKCATLPQKVRYTDDEHMLTLSYGEETSTTTHWCEECEIKIGEDIPFYMCGYCCVALHIECLLGVDLYMMPGSSWLYDGIKVDVLLNNCYSTRPICSCCKTRCPHKIYFQCSGFIFCSTFCIRASVDRGNRLA